MAFAGSGDFKCPKCGGGTWGTGDMTVPRESWIGYCHTTGCRFKWKRSEEVELGLFHVRAHSPEPAAKTELSAYVLHKIRCRAEYAGEGANADQTIRLLDEHTEQRERIAELERQMTARYDAFQRQSLRAEAAESRIAELESALAIATEAVAAEARAKVEGLTCTELDRAVLDAASKMSSDGLRSSAELVGNVPGVSDDMQHAADFCRAELARREAAKAKGDGNG